MAGGTGFFKEGSAHDAVALVSGPCIVRRTGRNQPGAQAAVNASLRESLSSPSAAAFVSYLGGTIVMGLGLALGRRVGLPPGQLTEAVVRGVPWWAWSGGLLGSIYVVISVLLVPRLGTATVLSLFVLGQMVASVAFDHFGLFGLAQRSPTSGESLVRDCWSPVCC